MALLEVKNLKKNFGVTGVLKGISFSIEKGEIVAIIGSSGSGKSTLLRCLNFLERADSGEIIVDGESIFNGFEKINDEEILREKRLHFGLVFQQFNLFPHMTVLKNVSLALDLMAKENLRKTEMKKSEFKTLSSKTQAIFNKNTAVAKVDLKNNIITKAEFEKIIAKENQTLNDIISIAKEKLKKKKITKVEYKEILKKNEETSKKTIEKVGLSDKLASYPCELSGGQQQRVAIARALVLKPAILCFDEPTSALDPELTNEVLRVIKNLKSAENTMIVVTHEMDFAKNVADKIVFMANGIIEEIGTPKEIFENPKSEKTLLFLKQYLNREDTSAI